MKIAFPVKLAVLMVLLSGVQITLSPALAQPISKDAYDCPEFLIPRKDKQTNLYGYVDIGGNYIIPPTYLQAGYFQGKNARVQMGKKFGVINCQGQLVVLASFDVIDDFVNGFGWVQQNGKWGLMRSDGKLEVPPAFDSVNAVSRRSSLTWVYKDSLWGIFDKDSRKMVIKPSYKMYRNVTDSLVIGRYDAWFDIVDLKKQLAIVDSATQITRLTPFVLGYKKRRWGLATLRGRLELPPQADTLIADTSFIIAWQRNRPSLYTKFGRLVLIKHPIDSLALTGFPLVRYRNNAGYGLLNASGRKVFKDEYDQVLGPLGRYALLKRGAAWQLYRQGSKAVDGEKYDSVQVLNAGKNFAAYTKGVAMLYSSASGSIGKGSMIKWIYPDTGHLVRVNLVKDELGLLNLSNSKILLTGTESQTNTPKSPQLPPTHTPKFSTPQAPLFTFFSKYGKLAVYNYSSQKRISEPEFDHVQVFTFQGRPAFAATKDGDLIVRDGNGKAIVQKEIKGGQLPVIPFNNFGLFFKRKGEYGGIALNGDEVVKPTYDTVLVPQETNPQVFLGKKGADWSLVGSDGKRILSDIRNAHFIGFSMWAGNQKGTNKVFDYAGGEKKAPPFDSLAAFSENLAAIKAGGKWGFVDRNFSTRIPPTFEFVTPFYKGKSVVRVGGLYGLINQQGKYLLKPRFANYKIQDGQYNLN